MGKDKATRYVILNYPLIKNPALKQMPGFCVASPNLFLFLYRCRKLQELFIFTLKIKELCNKKFMQNIKNVDIRSIKLNDSNPRFIKDESFAKLVKSLKSFPEMMQLRPVVVNDQGIILGGNMRYRAAKEAGWKEIPVIDAGSLR